MFLNPNHDFFFKCHDFLHVHKRICIKPERRGHIIYHFISHQRYKDNVQSHVRHAILYATYGNWKAVKLFGTTVNACTVCRTQDDFWTPRKKCFLPSGETESTGWLHLHSKMTELLNLVQHVSAHELTMCQVSQKTDTMLMRWIYPSIA